MLISRLFTIILMAAFVLASSACGRKGPLFIEVQRPPAQAQDSAPQAVPVQEAPVNNQTIPATSPPNSTNSSQ